MKYYYITEGSTHYEVLGSSILGISNNNNKHLQYDANVFWEITKPINLVIYNEKSDAKLGFTKYVLSDMYVLLMIPELKAIFEQFSMPAHKWYQAEAGYDLKYIHDMKRFHNIEYNINEKKEYWVLQMLDRKYQELDFQNTIFNIVDYDTRNIKKTLNKGNIIDYQQLRERSQYEYLNNDNGYLVKPSKYIYRKSYDILWAGTKVVFNDEVKTALEATNIITPENGLQFAEFTDYEIEMLGEGV